MVPPALGEAQREELRAAVQQLPAAAGLDLANWNWKVVHRFVWERFGLSLCRRSCLTYLPTCAAWDLPSSAPRSGC